MTKELGCKHGHMIGISKVLMEDGMNKDYAQIYKVTTNVYKRVKAATKIVATDLHGTEITFDLNPDKLKWVQDNGKIGFGEMRNLPGGEVFGSPENANGVMVVWELGDYFSEKYGVLEESVKVTLEDGFITDVVASIDKPSDKTLEIIAEFKDYIAEFENGKRAGELGIGTLVGLEGFVGNLLQDEKFPGIHVAFGNPYPDETGADWKCPTHIDMICKDVTIKVYKGNSEETIMNDGKFTEEILQ